MLSKIRLYGRLAEVCGNTTTYEAVLNTPADAIRFLINNFENANKHISQNNYQHYLSIECEVMGGLYILLHLIFSYD